MLRQIANIRDILPKSDLLALKNGADITDIYNELKARLLALENRLMRFTARSDDAVERIFTSMKDNIRAQEQMNKGPLCFQIPFMYNQKPTSLTMYVFDHKKGGRGKKADDALNVALNLETEKLGTVDVGMVVSDKRVDLDISVQNRGVRNYLEGISGSLNDRIEDAGFTVGVISCSVRGAAQAAKNGVKPAKADKTGRDGAKAGANGDNNPVRVKSHKNGAAGRYNKTGYAGVDIKV